MRALILAAGRGARLNGLTESLCKPMVAVNGEPLLVCAIRQLAAQGVAPIGIVIGYRGEELKQAVLACFPDLDFTFIENAGFESGNNIVSVHLAADFLAAGDCLLLEGDILFAPALLAAMLAAPRGNLAVVSPYQSWMDGGVVTLRETGLVDQFHRRPPRGRDSYKTVNLYRLDGDFSRTILTPMLARHIEQGGTQDYYETAFALLCRDGRAEFAGLVVALDQWIEIDDAVDLEQAGTLFGPKRETYRAAQRRYGGYWRFPWLIDAAYLVNAHYPPPEMLQDIADNGAALARSYPSGQNEQARLAAECCEIPAEFLVVGNGACELLAALLPALAGPVLVPLPVFEEYRARLDPDRRIETRAASADQLLAEARQSGCRSVILVNPNNPTGTLLPKNDVLALAEALAAERIRLILDESFIDFADDVAGQSLMDEVTLAAYPNLVLVKSLSKSHGIGGLRLGVLATSDPVLRAEIIRRIAIWNINSFAEYYLQLFRKYRGDFRRSLVLSRQDRAAFAEALAAMDGVEPLPSQANFLLCRLPDRIDAEDLCATMQQTAGILIKNCTGRHGMGEGNFIRIAVKTRDENERIAAALTRYLSPVG